MTIVLAIIIGVCAGIASGLFGVGGGIIIVPLLVWIMKYPHLQANGVSLIALMLPVGSLSIYQYYKNGYISTGHFKWGFLIGLGVFIGGFMGAKMVPYLNLLILKRLFGLLLFLGAIRLWFFDSKS